MKSFGEKLREAREAKGLTCSQVAEKTRILVQIVEELEKEDFHRIAAPIYGRGFVRLYAQCVGLDPVELNREFMEIYEGHRAPIVKTRSVPSRSETPPPAPTPKITPQEIVPSQETTPSAEVTEPLPSAPEVSTVTTTAEEQIPEPISDELPPIVKGLDLFESQRNASATVETPISQKPASPSISPAPSSVYESPYISGSSYYHDEDRYSPAEKFKQGLSSVSRGIVSTVRTIPRSTWRIGILAIAAIVVISLIVVGISQLYKMTSGSDIGPIEDVNIAKVETPDVKPPAAKEQKKVEKKKPQPASTPIKGLKSTGHKIPTLYID